MKTNDFELTRERKNILRKIKRNNVIDRSIAVSVSPIVVSVALVMLPVALVKTVAKHRKEPLKKLGNRLSKAFVKAVKFPKDVTEEVFKTGSAQLKSARESFAKEDVKKAELARKEEENRIQKEMALVKDEIENLKEESKKIKKEIATLDEQNSLWQLQYRKFQKEKEELIKNAFTLKNEIDISKLLAEIGYDTRSPEAVIASAWAFCRRFCPELVGMDKDIMHLVDNVVPQNNQFMSKRKFLHRLTTVAENYKK